jgi:hypothetical protein
MFSGLQYYTDFLRERKRPSLRSINVDKPVEAIIRQFPGNISVILLELDHDLSKNR